MSTTMTTSEIIEDCIARVERALALVDEWLTRWPATGTGGSIETFWRRGRDRSLGFG